MSDEDWGDDAPMDDGDDGGWGDDAQAKGEEEGEWEDADFDGDGGGGDDGDAFDGDGGDGGGLSTDIQIANIFYEAEDIRRENPSLALQKFQQVVALANKAKEEGSALNEESKTNHFNSIVHIVCLLYQIANSHSSTADPSSSTSSSATLSDMLAHYRLLLDFIPHVTRNESGEAIDRVLSATAASRDFNFLLQMYEITEERLRKMPDTERMMFNVQMKLCKTYMEKGDFEKAQEVLSQLLLSCQVDGVDDRKNRGSDLLEIYALQIKMSQSRGDSLRMKELYNKTKDLTAAVKDPRSQSVIRECWGIMFGEEGQWQRAYAEFYSAFTHYQEIGNRDKAKQCLKYVVVANMLSGGEQNPFDAREAKVYQNEPDVAAIGALRAAYEKCDVDAFSAALGEIQQAGDKFISTHLDSMILDFHRRAILQTLKSYRRLKLSFLASRLRVSASLVETILVQLILDGEVAGRIDQVAGVVDLTQRTGGAAKKYAAMQQWTNTLRRLTQSSTQAQQQAAY